MRAPGNAMRDWSTELDPDERDRILTRVADSIVRRRMEVPAVLLLEMHKPLAFVASQGIVVASPFLAPVVGLDNVQAAAQLLQSRDNVERLIQRIEDLSQDRSRPSTPDSAKKAS